MKRIILYLMLGLVSSFSGAMAEEVGNEIDLEVGISDWVEVEIECVDTEMLRANGDETELSLIYNRQSQILTVTINGATQSRSTIDDTYTIQLWNEMNMLREFKQNEPVVQIPMTGLKSGLYIIRYANKDKVIAKKFMKL